MRKRCSSRISHTWAYPEHQLAGLRTHTEEQEYAAVNRLVAAIVSLEHLDREALALSTSSEFMAVIEEARREIANGQTMTFDEMKRAVLP